MTSLFRYGNRLLLRNCCCPPPPPPPPYVECFCGSWCSYFAEWDGNLPKTSAITTGGPPVCESFSNLSDGRTPAGSFGVIGEINPSPSSISRGASGFDKLGDAVFAEGPFVAYLVAIMEIRGKIDCRLGETCFSEQDCEFANQQFGGLCQGQYYHFFSFAISCVFDSAINTERPVLKFNAYLGEYFAQSRLNLNTDFPYSFIGVAEGVIDSDCKSVVQCPANAPLQNNVSHVHIDGNDLEVSWSSEGLTVGGVSYNWEIYESVRRDDWWEAEGFPASETVTFKRAPTCAPGECDCNASLVGMIVEFAGEEFVLNTDAFIGTIEANGTTWSHVSGTKIFSRVDYSECTVQEVLTEAELFCQDDEWFVTFTRQCAELTNNGCTGVGLRSAQWVGRFVCDEDGRPVGEPLDVELDSDDEGADCSIGTPPFFRISAPP